MERSCKKQALPTHPVVWFQDGSGKSGVGQIPALVSGGTGLGLLHLQQSLNKSWVSGAEVEGELVRERRGSVSAAGGQNPDPAGPGQRAPPFSGDWGGACIWPGLSFQIWCHHGPFRVPGSS